MDIPVNIPIVGQTVPSVQNPSDSFDWGGALNGAVDVLGKAADTWLGYQQVKRGGDLSGANQHQLYQNPTTTAPDVAVSEQSAQSVPASVAGVSLQHVALGVGALGVLYLLLK